MAGSGVGGGRNGGAGDNSVLLTVEVDANTGSLVVKNFSQLLGQLGQQAQAAGEQAGSSGGGWQSLANALTQSGQGGTRAAGGIREAGTATGQTTSQIERMLLSVQKQAALFGKTGIDKMATQLGFLTEQYKDNQRVVDILTASYGHMIGVQSEMDFSRQKNQLDQFITSLQKEAELFGRSGIDALTAKRNQLLTEYQKEPAALAAITAAYGSMISQQEKLDFQGQKNQLDQFIGSLQKQAALFGTSGVDKMIAERAQLLQQYAKEPEALEAIRAAYEKMFAAEAKATQTKVDEKAAATLANQKQALDQFISSLQKQADLFGKSGIDKMEAERNQLLQEYKNEPAAINAITSAYSRMIEVQKQQDFAGQKAASDALVSSLQKQADLYGKSGVDKLVAERNQLLQQYAKEPEVLAAIQAAYTKMIAAEQTAGQTSNQPKWLEMFAQVELVSRAIEGFVDVSRNLIVESTLIAAKVQVLNTVLQVTSRNMLISNSAAQAQVQAISQLNITQREATETVLQLERSQIDLAKGTDLARAAQDLAVVSNQNSSEALRTLIEASQEHRAILLKQFGIVTLEAEIFERYAASVNKSSGALTEQEKTQAFVNEILTQAQKVQGAYSAAMDDAGKKRTSLTRVEETARVHIGQQFLPVMNEAIDVLIKAGEAAATLDPNLIKVAGSAIVGATAFVGLVGALGLVTTAIKAIQATAFAAEVLSFINPVTIAIAAVTALATAFVLFKSSTDNAAKQTQEMGDNAQALAKRLDDLDAKYRKLIQTEKELAAVRQNPKQENGNQLREAQLTIQYYDQLNDLKQAGQKIDSGLINLGEGRNKTSTQGLINLRLETQIRQQNSRDEGLSLAAQKDLISSTQQRITQAQTLNNRYREDYEALKKNHEITEETNASWFVLPGLIQKSQKEVDELNAKLDGYRKKLNEAQNQQKRPDESPRDLQLDVTQAALAKSLELDTRINEARRQGAQITGQLDILQKQSIENAISQIGTEAKNLELARSRNQEQLGYDKQILENRRSSADEVAKANADTLVQNNTIEKSVALQAKLKDLEAGLRQEVTSQVPNRQKILDTAKGLIEVSKNAAEITKDTATTLGNMPALYESTGNLQTAANAANRADQERLLALAGSLLHSRQAVLASETQSVGVRRQQLDIEKLIAENSLRQQILSQSIPKAQRTVLQSNLGQQDLNRRLAFERELADSRTSLELDTDTKLRQAYGSTVEDQIEASNRRYGMERENFIRQYAGARDLGQRLVLLEQAHQADLNNITDKGLEDRLKLTNDIAKQQLDTVQAGISERGFIRPEDLSALENFYQKANAAELTLFQNSKAFQDELAANRTQAQQLLAAKETDLNLKTQAAISRARRQAEEEQESRARDRQTALLQGAAATGTISDIEAERQEKILDVRKRLADLSYNGIITAGEYLRLLTAQTDEINKQAKSAENRQTLDRAQTVLDTPGTSPEGQQEAVKHTLDTIHDNQQKVIDLNDALDSGAIKWDQYAKEIAMVGQTIPTIETLFQAIMTGAAGSITAIDALTAGFQVVGTAASAAFEAMGQGADVGKAVKNAFAGIFKELGAMAMKRSMFWLAAAIADTFALDPRAAGEYAAAAEWGAAAAVLGVSGGALSGGGSGSGKGGGGLAGGSGGPNQAGSKAEGLQQIAPPKTQTDVTGDNITRLSEGLVVQGRQIQAAGDKFNNLGGQIYQFINTEKQLANSQYQNQRNIADNNALQFDRLINSGGITGPQFQALNSYFLAQADKVTTNRDEGLQKVSETLNTALKSNTDAVAKIANQGVSTGASSNQGTQQTQPLEVMSDSLLNQFAGLNTTLNTANTNLTGIHQAINTSSSAAQLSSAQLKASLQLVAANTGDLKESFLRKPLLPETGTPVAPPLSPAINNTISVAPILPSPATPAPVPALVPTAQPVTTAIAAPDPAVEIPGIPGLTASILTGNNSLEKIFEAQKNQLAAVTGGNQSLAAIKTNTALTNQNFLRGEGPSIPSPTVTVSPSAPPPFDLAALAQTPGAQGNAFTDFSSPLQTLNETTAGVTKAITTANTQQLAALTAQPKTTADALGDKVMTGFTGFLTGGFPAVLGSALSNTGAGKVLDTASNAPPSPQTLATASGSAPTSGATLNDVVQSSVDVEKAINDANGKQIAALNAQPKATSDSIGDKILQGFANFETGGVFGLVGGIFNWMASNHIADAIQKQTDTMLPAYAKVQLAVSSLSASLNEKLNGVVKQIQESATYNQDKASVLAALNQFTSSTLTQANQGIQSTLSGIQLPTVAAAPDLSTQTAAFNQLSRNLSGIETTLGTQFGALQTAVTNQTSILNLTGTTTNQLLTHTNQKLGVPGSPAAITVQNAPQAPAALPPPVPIAPSAGTHSSASGFEEARFPVLSSTPLANPIAGTTPTSTVPANLAAISGLSSTLGQGLSDLKGSLQQGFDRSVFTMQDWAGSLRTEQQASLAGNQGSLANLSDALSAKLNAVANTQSGGTQATNDILRGIHEESVKANEKNPSFQFPITVAIDGEPVANAVVPHLSGNAQFGKTITGSVLSATQYNSQRRDIGRALSSGDV